METKPPENAGQKIDPDIVSKIKSGRVVTQVMEADMLPVYLKAGLATGFKVEKIADEGEEFPCLFVKLEKDGKGMISEPEYDIDGSRKVSMVKVTKQGNIAVSIERPEGSDLNKGHSPFWDKLNTESWKK